MKELDDIKEQEELIYYAMHDSYRIITNKISTAGFMIEKDKQDIDFVLLFDIHDLRNKKRGIKPLFYYKELILSFLTSSPVSIF